MGYKLLMFKEIEVNNSYADYQLFKIMIDIELM